MKQTTSGPVSPSANLCIGKSRIKRYNNAGELPTYYLQKGQEFAVELFNPTQDVILCKISLNNKPIAQGGLVLNPGERVFLDRYIDVPKKFLFDVYEVSNTEEVKKAIEKNGDFKVEFFKERIINNPIIINYPNTVSTSKSNFTIYGTGGSSNIPCSNTNGSSTTTNFNNCTSSSSTAFISNNAFYTNTSGISSPTNLNSTKSYSSNNDSSATMDWMQPDMDITIDSAPVLKPQTRSRKSIETGRVEMGSNSNQQLTRVNKNWEYFYFHKVEYKMLPISQKINTSADIKVKRYCVNCGAKIGKTDNFCSQCSHKI